MKTQNSTQLALFVFINFFVLQMDAQSVICGDTTNPNYISFEDTIIVSGNTYDVKYDLTGDGIADLYFDVISTTSMIGYTYGNTTSCDVIVTNPAIELMIQNYAFGVIALQFEEGDTVNLGSDLGYWDFKTNASLYYISTGPEGGGGDGAWSFDTIGYLGFRYVGPEDTLYGWFHLRRNGITNLYVMSATVFDIDDFNIIPWSFEKDNGISFFPNPATYRIMPVVGFSGKYYLYNYGGSLIYSSEYKDNELIYFPKEIKNGLYLIQFLGDDESTKTDHLIIYY